MKSHSQHSRAMTLFLAARPKFLVASIAPILVGSLLGYVTIGAFSPHLFVLALLAMMALNVGANMANDYFDHLSGNDWVNKNITPFSGGSRYIQEDILPPKTIFLAALSAFAVGSALGLVIVFLTRSVFILIMGILGLLAGFFYTAGPIRLGYRGIGEFVIAAMCGLFPVYASYHLQTSTIDAIPLLPALIISILIFLVILINEFPDMDADAAANKNTLVVRCGMSISVWIYRVALVTSFVIAALAVVIYRAMLFAGLFYSLTLPIAVFALKAANKQDLAKPGQYRASQVTVLMHSIGSLALAVGLITFRLVEARLQP